MLQVQARLESILTGSKDKTLAHIVAVTGKITVRLPQLLLQ